MKILMILFLAAVAQAEDTVKAIAPKVLSAEQKEALSIKLIALQDEEIAYQQLQIQIQQAEKRVVAAKQDMDMEIETIRKASGAPANCSLTKTKEWSCPK